jgi:NAD(P)-dependent dehydrogenase (short-subunit alcohol dehydrogenase family)
MTGTMLAGKHAIVTGGGKGIGAAIAQALVAQGAKVSILGRDQTSLHAQVTKLGPNAFAHECDITNDASIARAFAACFKHSGDPYILVNNAGQAEAAGFAEMSRELWDRMIAVNLTGTFLCTQQVIGKMTAARSGRIVNVASTAALKGYSKISAYCASKHGALGLTRALAQETVKLGITVNAVCPGYTDTEMVQRGIRNLQVSMGKSPEEAKQMLLRGNPRGTFITPEEVAAAIVFLCSPEASAMTGLALPIAAGEAM